MEPGLSKPQASSFSCLYSTSLFFHNINCTSYSFREYGVLYEHLELNSKQAKKKARKTNKPEHQASKSVICSSYRGKTRKQEKVVEIRLSKKKLRQVFKLLFVHGLVLALLTFWKVCYVCLKNSYLITVNVIKSCMYE